MTRFHQIYNVSTPLETGLSLYAADATEMRYAFD